jgi:hypothetical protein
MGHSNVPFSVRRPAKAVRRLAGTMKDLYRSDPPAPEPRTQGPVARRQVADGRQQRQKGVASRDALGRNPRARAKNCRPLFAPFGNGSFGAVQTPVLRAGRQLHGSVWQRANGHQFIVLKTLQLERSPSSQSHAEQQFTNLERSKNRELEHSRCARGDD